MKNTILAFGVIVSISFSVNAELMKIVATGNVATHTEVPVEYSFLFDTEQDGFYLIDTIKYPIYDLDNTDYFYADFQGKYVLPDYITVNSEHNYGYEYTGDTPVVTVVLGGTPAHRVQIISNSSIDTWGIDTKFLGIEQSLNSNNVWESVFSDLKVTKYSPVPEPSIVYMSLSGLILLSVFLSLSYRKKAK